MEYRVMFSKLLGLYPEIFLLYALQSGYLSVGYLILVYLVTIFWQAYFSISIQNIMSNTKSYFKETIIWSLGVLLLLPLTIIVWAMVSYYSPIILQGQNLINFLYLVALFPLGFAVISIFTDKNQLKTHALNSLRFDIALRSSAIIVTLVAFSVVEQINLVINMGLILMLIMVAIILIKLLAIKFKFEDRIK